MSFVMHEIIYFGRAAPWMIIDRIPYFNKYKIQNVCIVDCSFFLAAGNVGLLSKLDPDISIAKNTHGSRTMELR